MNATFHTLAALATAAVLSSKDDAGRQLQASGHARLPLLAGGFAVGIMLHGILDYLPHSYPIKSSLDVVFSLALFALVMILTRRRNWLLIASCLLGAWLPDLVDLGPAIINKHLHWSLPVVRMFPWHWRQYSGSIYNGGRAFESLLLHCVVVGLSVGLLYRYRKQFFVFGGREVR